MCRFVTGSDSTKEEDAVKKFLRDEGSDSEEVSTPLMLDVTSLSRNFCCLALVRFLTLQPLYGKRPH